MQMSKVHRIPNLLTLNLAIPPHQEVLNFENDVSTSLGLASFRRCIPCVNIRISCNSWSSSDALYDTCTHSDRSCLAHNKSNVLLSYIPSERQITEYHS